jgi:hypothetical protein
MYNKMKICCECNIEKDLDQFSKNKNIKDGFNNRCKICCSIRNRKRYELKKKILKLNVTNITTVIKKPLKINKLEK